MLPRLALMGIMMLANLLALLALSRSWSLSRLKSSSALLLVTEYLDHLLPSHHFLNVAVDRPRCPLLLPEVLAGLSA